MNNRPPKSFFPIIDSGAISFENNKAIFSRFYKYSFINHIIRYILTSTLLFIALLFSNSNSFIYHTFIAFILSLIFNIFISSLISYKHVIDFNDNTIYTEVSFLGFYLYKIDIIEKDDILSVGNNTIAVKLNNHFINDEGNPFPIEHSTGKFHAYIVSLLLKDGKLFDLNYHGYDKGCGYGIGYEDIIDLAQAISTYFNIPLLVCEKHERLAVAESEFGYMLKKQNVVFDEDSYDYKILFKYLLLTIIEYCLAYTVFFIVLSFKIGWEPIYSMFSRFYEQLSNWLFL